MKHHPTTFKTSEILELLWAYQGVIGIRPFSEGNREFLDVLFGASRKLAVALKRTPIPQNINRNDIATLIGLIDEQAVTNHTQISPRILDLVDKLKERLSEADSKPTIQGSLSELSTDYSRITAIFGPASGLGDQITFFQFFSALKNHCPDAEIIVYSLYPDIWKKLIPGVKEIEFRGEPMRPFEDMAKVTSEEEYQQSELVFYADFESFDLHKKLVPPKPNRDVLELAMGRWKVSMNEQNSPWYKVKVFNALTYRNNYSYVDALSGDLLGVKLHNALWKPVVDYQNNTDTKSTFKVFLNTFSSKELPYTPEHWAQLVLEIKKKAPRGVVLELIVFPGLDKLTQDYVAGILKHMKTYNPEMQAKVLAHPDGSEVNPQNAIDAILSQVADFDCCITLDTFTAHLLPLFGLPTFVIAYKENYEFWVPSPWTFYVTLKTVESHLPELMGNVIQTMRKVQPGNEAMQKVVAAGEYAKADCFDENAVQNIVGTLNSLLQNIDKEFPYLWQARQWLFKWSQLAAADRSDPVDSGGLYPFLFAWTSSEFYKLLYLLCSTKKEKKKSAKARKAPQRSSV